MRLQRHGDGVERVRDDALDLDSPETVAALGRSLTQLGPRRLVAVLEADGQAARVVRAALAELDREAV